jgi:nitrate/nitrite transport system ATP-binding protein
LPNTSREYQEAKTLAPATHMADLHSDRYVEFSKVSKIYRTKRGTSCVVEDFDLKIKKGEFVSIIGHSGCGKSTMLTMVAGLNEISDGARSSLTSAG